MMYLPAGHYTLEKMLTYLNDLVDEYDMTFILQGGRVGVKFNPTPVMINQLSKNDDGSTWDTDFTVPAKLYLGPDLFDFDDNCFGIHAGFKRLGCSPRYCSI